MRLTEVLVGDHVGVASMITNHSYIDGITLRGPDGCPWDRKQTLASIKPYTLEETYELLEAIDADDNAAIAEELGDVLEELGAEDPVGGTKGTHRYPI